MTVLNIEKLIDNRIKALQDFHKTSRVVKAELDLSGGVDSAVMAYLLVEALGPENVLLVHTNINTNPKQTQRAKELAKALNAPSVNFNLTQWFMGLTEEMEKELRNALFYVNGISERLPLDTVQKQIESDPTILGSIRSCLRAPIGRGFNRMNLGGIRHGTGNECEDRFLRFYQKGGDGEVDTNPMGMLTKTEVFQLAFGISQRHPNSALGECFKELISIKPSPDLWGAGDDHNDEDEMKKWTGVAFTYGQVDPETGKVLKYGTIERVARFLDIGEKTIESVIFGTREIFRPEWLRLAKAAMVLRCFPDEKYTLEEIADFLHAARKIEKMTRHKENPNIPQLGTRAELIKANIITDRMG